MNSINIEIDGQKFSITIREKEAMTQEDDWSGYSYQIFDEGEGDYYDESHPYTTEAEAVIAAVEAIIEMIEE